MKQPLKKVMVSGLPGSGKSTVVEMLVDHTYDRRFLKEESEFGD